MMKQGVLAGMTNKTNTCGCFMTKEQFHKFMQDQTNEINIYKWVQSERVGHDLGNECCIEWVMKFAKKFREDWERKNNT